MSESNSRIQAVLTSGMLMDSINGLMIPGRTSREILFEYNGTFVSVVIGRI